MVISNKPLSFILAAFVASLPIMGFANSENDSTHVQTETAHEEKVISHDAPAEGEHAVALDPKAKVDAFIDHHLQDSHDFVFFQDEKENKHFGFPLPVILIDGGLKVFSSSKFHFGETVAEVDGNFYKLVHGKIYKTDAAGTITFNEHGHPENEKPLDFSMTKNVVSMLFVAVLLFLMFTGLAKSYKKGPIPTGFGRVLEPLIIFIRDEIAVPNIGEKKYRKYMGSY